MIDKGWVVEEDDRMIIYNKRPKDCKSFEAVIKIMPINRSLDRGWKEASSAIKKAADELEKLKKAAKDFERKLSKGR